MRVRVARAPWFGVSVSVIVLVSECCECTREQGMEYGTYGDRQIEL